MKRPRLSLLVLWSVSLSRLALGFLAVVFASEVVEGRLLGDWRLQLIGALGVVLWVALGLATRSDPALRNSRRRQLNRGIRPLHPAVEKIGLAIITGFSAGMVIMAAFFLILGFRALFSDLLPLHVSLSEGAAFLMGLIGVTVYGSSRALIGTLLLAASYGFGAGLALVNLDFRHDLILTLGLWPIVMVLACLPVLARRAAAGAWRAGTYGRYTRT